MKKYIVLDKSFIKSSNPTNFRTLETDYAFLLTEEFLYETFKDSPKNRADTFKKFRNQNSYQISPSINELITYEATKKKPIKPSDHLVYKYKGFHDNYKNPFYPLSQTHLSEIESQAKFMDKIFLVFKNQILEPKFKKKIDDKNSNQLIDDDELVNILNKMIKNGDINLHKDPIPNLNSSWITYRFYQILNYYAYDLVQRYSNYEIIEKSTKTQMKIKHDLIDFFYIIQSLIEGGLATSENRIKQIWEKYATPGSVLIFLQNKKIEIFEK